MINPEGFAARASRIREVWTDVDGVLTGSEEPIQVYELLDPGGQPVGLERHLFRRKERLGYIDEEGALICSREVYLCAFPGKLIAEGYTFNTRDGKVVEYLLENDIPVHFISGRTAAPVKERALALKAVPHLGVKKKFPYVMERVVQIPTITLSEILFVGDGIQDVELMQAVHEAGGIAIAPADACEEALRAATCATNARGGAGVLYEIGKHLLTLRGLWKGT